MQLNTTSSLTALATMVLGLFSTTTMQGAPVINWASVRANNEIQILGNGFGTTPGKVTIQGVAATVQSWSETSIDVTNPVNEPATSKIVVTTAGGVTVTGIVFNPVSTLSSVAHSRDFTESVLNVSVNGGANQAHVSPGGTVSVDLDYSGCLDCGLQFGLNTGAPQACFAAYPATGHETATLTAPTTPGIYTILFDRNQNNCQAVWDYGTPPPTQAIGAISVY